MLLNLVNQLQLGEHINRISLGIVLQEEGDECGAEIGNVVGGLVVV